MELRTTVRPEPSERKITYDDKVMFIGSCFASYMGSQLEAGHMPVMINPSGAVFNPVSVLNTLDTITRQTSFTIDDLHLYDGMWISFNHYTDFSSDDPAKALSKINKSAGEAYAFLQDASFLFVTFGTARVYRLKKSGKIVSNCHKIPNEQFNTELLTVDSIVELWSNCLDRLHAQFPELKIVFTISPVRHWKDGAHGNQVSKSTLFLAVEELLKHNSRPGYFPAYEIVIDDLRDYRFYADDMLHPSATTVNYIWEAFSDCFLDKTTQGLWKEVSKITRAVNHRITTDSEKKKELFAQNMLNQISVMKSKLPAIDLSSEENYFLKMRRV